jgi:uncharacterized protein YjcR
MADYFGVNAIAARMGVDPVTIRRWHRRRNFLIYRRWNTVSKRQVWYTNDALIFAWEREQCTTQRSGSGAG